MISTPYKIAAAIAALVLLVAAGLWYLGKERAAAYAAGEIAERGRWQARESEELRRANADLVDAHARAAELERQAAEDLAAAERRRIKEVADAEARKDAFVSAVVRGDVRLFDPCRAAAGEGAHGDAARAAPAAAPERDAAADLREAYARRVARTIELADEADAVVRAAQETIGVYLRTCNGRPPAVAD